MVAANATPGGVSQDGSIATGRNGRGPKRPRRSPHNTGQFSSLPPTALAAYQAARPASRYAAQQASLAALFAAARAFRPTRPSAYRSAVATARFSPSPILAQLVR